MAFRLFVVPAVTLGALAFVLTRGGYPYGRLAGFVAAFILTVDLVTFAKARLQNALVVVATIFFGLAVMETVGQAIMPHTVFDHAKGLFGDRDELGWGPIKPGVYPAQKSIDGKTVYSVRYTIDDDLTRKVDSNFTGPTVAFFGDSFTFGDGVEDQDTLPQQFSDAARCFHVVNLAFSAYSPSQMLRALQTGLFDRLLRKPRLFVIQTGAFHVERVVCKPNFSLRGPRYVSIDGSLEYKGACTSGVWRRMREFAAETALERLLVAPVARRATGDDVGTYIDILGAIEKMAREKYHVPLVVLYVPDELHQLDGTGYADPEVRKRLEKLGIHLLDTDVESAPGDVLRVPGDGHPSGTLNRLLASKLLANLRDALPGALQGCQSRDTSQASGH